MSESRILILHVPKVVCEMGVCSRALNQGDPRRLRPGVPVVALFDAEGLVMYPGRCPGKPLPLTKGWVARTATKFTATKREPPCGGGLEGGLSVVGPARELFNFAGQRRYTPGRRQPNQDKMKNP